jgi:hypothetical protein
MIKERELWLAEEERFFETKTWRSSHVKTQGLRKLLSLIF